MEKGPQQPTTLDHAEYLDNSPQSRLAAHHHPSTLDKHSMTCLRVWSAATSIRTNKAGRTCRFTGVVDSNYGRNSDGTGGEDANQTTSPPPLATPATAAALDNVYTQDCFTDNIHSYF
ncbi:uncharacterized protein GLRG_10294 [Colletotrichum graminicola M1.001]|uniref:DUF8213 domain-containing protein n=1 Tax=Colletotrichum graminicola (strain M1.001 / M2 / FGSC 10212) TaxID=645133 RepID=E3QWB6_COLGM|nr:uncharacterized protein GLRG_10294 [Colletotrichum graminicola M1.001]EFQ35150.1 hypothetical protein GLRG_10294 [Colletotrichum graminicola M1.001]